MFLNGSLSLQIYADTSQTVFPQLNQPNLAIDWTNSSVAGSEQLYFNLDALGSQTINLNNLTGVTQWFINSDATPLNLTINGTAGFVCSAAIPGYIPIALTSLIIANSSASIATNVNLILIKG